MTRLIVLLALTAFDCQYWLQHFDMVEWFEQAIEKARREGDEETVRYFRKLIRKQIQEAFIGSIP